MAYFDNAATTFPKPECVYGFMDRFYRECGGNAGRGDYKESQNVGSLVAETRKKISKLFKCPAKQVVFTPSATIALNIVLQGVITDKTKTVYISPFEHNAVTRVLYSFEKRGKIKVVDLFVDDCFHYDIDRIRVQFEEKKPDVVVMSHASNVFGLISPVEAVFKQAKKYGAITVADMAQTAGLIETDVGLEEFDFAVFAGHKTLYGPTGIAGFVMNPEIDIHPVLYGGTGYDSSNPDMPESIPERFEMGTLNTLGIAGLNAAISWIEETGIDVIRSREHENRSRLINIISQYQFMRPVGVYDDKDYVGIVSVLIDGISSDSAANIFTRNNIAVRTGLHCAPHAHRFAKTFPAGTIRFSPSYFTTEQDFEDLRMVLDYISGEL